MIVLDWRDPHENPGMYLQNRHPTSLFLACCQTFGGWFLFVSLLWGLQATPRKTNVLTKGTAVLFRDRHSAAKAELRRARNPTPFWCWGVSPGNTQKTVYSLPDIFT